jgi:peptidoglycan hydrolase CwlO-like protein
MTRVEINAELTKLRFEREKAQREVDNIQACMNELMRKRNDLDFQLKLDECGGDLYTAMFGG